MGTENPNRVNTYQRPNANPFAPPQSSMPISSSLPVVGSEASAFRPTPVPATMSTVPGTSNTTPFSSSGPAVGYGTPGFRPMQPGRPTPSFGPPTTGPIQRFPTPQFPSTSQPPLPQTSNAGPSILPPTMRPPPPSHVPSMSTSLNRQPQMPPPMGSPPQNLYSASSNSFPPRSFVDSPFTASRPNMQQPPLSTGPPYPSTLPGYQGMQSSPVSPPPPPPPLSYQGGYAPSQPTISAPFSSHQGAYRQVPPVASSPGMYSAPAMGPTSGLAEDFSSLSLGPAPGSFDSGVDAKVLPRPLDGDIEPSSFAMTYPMNCDSRYLRLTTSAIPNSQSLISRWQLPLGAVVCPLAETPKGEEVPVVNFATTGIVRCRRCRTYVNPYVTFTDSGRKWKCNICALLNDVQGDYYAQLDATGKRVDLDQHPELTKGSVEFVAPAEYMVRPPMPPVYFFLIDVSISAVKSGMLEVVAQTIKSCLDILPGSPRTQIGFITFDSTIHFYNMKSSLTQPQMMVVSDLDDIFVPLPDDLLVNLSESRAVVEAFLDSLPSLFQDNFNVESAFGPALKAANMVMSQLGGKLLIFQSTLPSLGVGRLKLRGDDLHVYGTDKEYTLRIPDDSFYKQMAADFTKFQIAVNVYAFGDKYTDVASLASCGERRIRVHTAAASVVTDLGGMYRQADTGAIVSLLGRLAIEKLLSYKLEDARNSIQARIIKALKEYRKLYAVQNRVGSRMIYPESLKYLPLYGLALCKSIALRGGFADAQLDERCAAGFTMMALPVKKMLKLLYPSLLRVDEYLVKTPTVDDEFNRICKRLPLAAESLDSRGIYVFDDGFRFVVWFGRMLSPDLARNLVEEDSSTDFSRNQVCLSERDNEMSRKLNGIIRKLRQADPSYYQLCHLVRQGEQPREGFFLLLNLVEDQVGSMNGYVDWMLQIHRQVLQ